MQESSNPCECPRCGHENPTDTNFCTACGLPIDGLCPKCGTRNERFTHFCAACEHNFVPINDQSSSDPPVGSTDLREQEAVPVVVNCPRCHHLNEASATSCYNCALPFDGTTRIAGNRLSQSIPAFTKGRPGGFWIRFLAALIDGVVVLPIVLILATTFSEISIDQYLSYYLNENPRGFNWSIEQFNFFEIIYHSVLVTVWATTVGKKASGLYVVRTDGGRIGFWQSLIRECAKVLSWITFGAGFLIVAFREDKRALHDLIAGTVIIKQ